MSFHVIIPARYQSTRLPGKPLIDIGNKSMIIHVCQQAKQSGAKSVNVATDHLEIKQVVESAGFDAIMTRSDHLSGSDRVYEAALALDLSTEDIIVNVQGDEPFIPSKIISQVASIIKQRDADMATLCCRINHASEAVDPNVVKVVFDKQKKAIYFSRSLIPSDRDSDSRLTVKQNIYFRHIGIYAYTKGFLKQFVGWPVSMLESSEKLEQLRVIENGKSIYLEVLDQAPPAGIDTAEDIRRANSYYIERLTRGK